MKLILSEDGKQIISLDDAIVNVPVKSGLLQALGLVDRNTKKFLQGGNVAKIPRLVESANVLTDIPYGTRPQTVGEGEAGYLYVEVPHFAATASIDPADIRGFASLTEFLEVDEEDVRFETYSNVMTKKMEGMRKSMVNTWEVALFNTLMTGDAYAPNGTILDQTGAPVNFYTLFGLTRQEFTVDALDDDADVEAQIEAAKAYIQDNMDSGSVVGEFYAIVGTTFFNALARNPEIRASIRAVGGDLARRLLIDGKPSEFGNAYRQIDYAGVTFIEDRYVMKGDRADQGFIFALDAPDLIRTYYAPPVDKFDLVNSIAQETYTFQYSELNTRHESVTFDHESNFLFALTRPQAIQGLVLGEAPAEPPVVE